MYLNPVRKMSDLQKFNMLILPIDFHQICTGNREREFEQLDKNLIC